jgi:hypothetical protein
MPSSVASRARKRGRSASIVSRCCQLGKSGAYGPLRFFHSAACCKVRISSARRLSSGVSVSHSFCSSQCITHPSRRRGLLHLCSLSRSIFLLRIIYVGCNVIADLGRLDTFLVDRRLRSKRCARAGCPLPMRPPRDSQLSVLVIDFQFMSVTTWAVCNVLLVLLACQTERKIAPQRMEDIAIGLWIPRLIGSRIKTSRCH